VHASRPAILRKPVLRVSAVVMIVAGAALCLLAIFADSLLPGGGRGFGYQQLIALIVGIVLILGGLALAFQRYLLATPHDSFEIER
jgi:hypothetical protein